MSYYYNYLFVSPEEIFAEVKEELKSYFDTSIVDDVLFPKHTKFCVDKIGLSARPLVTVKLNIKDYEAPLPEDFLKEREVLACYQCENYCHPSPVSTYVQDTSLSPVLRNNDPVLHSKFIHQRLLPAGISQQSSCLDGCTTPLRPDTYVIVAGQIQTGFNIGTIEFTYYQKGYDSNLNNLIPDIVEFKEYLKSYLKYKSFEIIYNNITDETLKQVESKLLFYKQQYDENYIICKCEFMKKTTFQVISSIKKTQNRFNYLEIP